MTGSCLRVKINSMRYPGGKESGNLIENLAFEVPPKSVVSFLGRSGAGKTTLLRMIAGLERRFIGEILLDGQPVMCPGRDIQLVFQDFRLFPWKTVYQNIEFATRRKDRAADRRQIEKWLEIVGLQHKRDAWPKTLSGGETGRVAFARAFVDHPKLLLLDEPFRALDLNSRFELQDELQKVLQLQNASVILVSHSVEDAVFLSDTVHVLSDKPMRIEATFHIDACRPRRRDDRTLSEMTTAITAHLISKRTI